MEGFQSFLARFFVSTLLVIFLFNFIIVISFSQELDENKVNDLIFEFAKQNIVQKTYEFDYGNYVSFDEVYSGLVLQCQGRDSLTLGESGIVLECAEIYELGPEGLEGLMQDKITVLVEEESVNLRESLDSNAWYRAIHILMGAAVFLGIITVILTLVLFLVSSPKYKFLYSFGMVGVIVGAIFLIVGLLKRAVLFPSFPLIENLADSFLRVLFINLFYVLLAGVLLLFMGIIIEGVYKKRKRVKKK